MHRYSSVNSVQDTFTIVSIGILNDIKKFLFKNIYLLGYF